MEGGLSAEVPFEFGGDIVVELVAEVAVVFVGSVQFVDGDAAGLQVLEVLLFHEVVCFGLGSATRTCI